jgi:hypothetical protein
MCGYHIIDLSYYMISYLDIYNYAATCQSVHVITSVHGTPAMTMGGN